MLVVYFYASPFSNNQFSPHCVIISCLNIIISIKVGMIASLYPHVEASIVAPTSSHQIPCC